MHTRFQIAKIFVALFAIAAIAGCSSGGGAASGSPEPSTKGGTSDKVKIGFIVKKPDEPWFQLEWKFADEAAKKDGFDLIKIPATDSAAVIPAIENVAAQGAQGLVICTPDVNLGPAIEAKCKERNLKLLTVDDQLVGPDKKFLDVAHVGISARKIGNGVGTSLVEEMKRRNWKPEETGMLVVTYEELDTARERTDGAIESAIAAGFAKDRIYKTNEKGQDIADSRAAATAILTQHQDIKNWLVTSMNDAGCLGAVRATEAFNLPADRVIGIGINGDTGAIEDLKKPKPTGLFGTVLLQAKRHGFDTADMMYKWIKEGTAPPKVTYTEGILMTRENYQQVMKDQGLVE